MWTYLKAGASVRQVQLQADAGVPEKADTLEKLQYSEKNQAKTQQHSRNLR